MTFVFRFIGAFLSGNSSERFLLHQVLNKFLVLLELVLQKVELSPEFQILILKIVSRFLILLILIIELLLFLVDNSSFEPRAALQI